MKKINIIILILLVAIMLFMLVKILQNGVRGYEEMECLKWQEQKKEYPLFTAPDWQIQQCKQFNIEL